MDIEWVDGFEIRVKVDHGAVVIAANRKGCFLWQNSLLRWQRLHRDNISIMTTIILWKKDLPK